MRNYIGYLQHFNNFAHQTFKQYIYENCCNYIQNYLAQLIFKYALPVIKVTVHYIKKSFDNVCYYLKLWLVLDSATDLNEEV